MSNHEEREREESLEKVLLSPSYRIAFKDVDFLSEPSLRPVRMQLELLKSELIFTRNNVESTVVVFGSTRIVEPTVAKRNLERAKAWSDDTPDDPRRRRAATRAERLCLKSHYYEKARQFAQLVSSHSTRKDRREYVIVTGGGPGIMEAANRGAYEVGAKSVGLNIRLPMEQYPNSYITPDLCFQFQYFAMRKFHFLLRAKALVVFPGGYGTLDELFDALTLRQTGRMQDIPIIVFGREYWEKVINFQYLADEGAIDDTDLDLISYAETPEEAWQMILKFHQEEP